MGSCSSTNHKAKRLKGADTEPIKPLPVPQAIRLLQMPLMEALQTLDDGRIQVEMVVEASQLDNCTKFTTLSYTWGNPLYDVDHSTADSHHDTQPSYLPNTTDVGFSLPIWNRRVDT